MQTKLGIITAKIKYIEATKEKERTESLDEECKEEIKKLKAKTIIIQTSKKEDEAKRN